MNAEKSIRISMPASAGSAVLRVPATEFDPILSRAGSLDLLAGCLDAEGWATAIVSLTDPQGEPAETEQLVQAVSPAEITRHLHDRLREERIERIRWRRSGLEPTEERSTFDFLPDAPGPTVFGFHLEERGLLRGFAFPVPQGRPCPLAIQGFLRLFEHLVSGRPASVPLFVD